MTGYKDSNCMPIDETTPTESFPDVPAPRPLSSVERTDTEHHQKAVTEHANTVDRDGCIGLFVKLQSHTSLQNSTDTGHSLENALSSLESHNFSSPDLSHFSQVRSDNIPSQHELQSYGTVGAVKILKEVETVPDKLQDGCCADIPDVQMSNTQSVDDSTASARRCAASLPSEKQHGTLDPDTGDVLKGMEGTISSQIDNESSAGFAHSEVSSTNVEEISMVEDRIPLNFNGHPQHNHVKAQNIQRKVPELGVSLEQVKKESENRGYVDTTAPFESVKEAVTKFGGIVDWKAHKALTVENRKHFRYELEKVQEELPIYRKKSEEAEAAQAEVLKELDTARRLVEELKLNLEKAETEEAQAKQDAELAQLREKEMEDGISDDVSVAAKMQLQVAKARHEAAVAELKFVNEELLVLKKQYSSSLSESEHAIKKAEEAVSVSKEMEKVLMDLTLELIFTKESLEAAHVVHIEAEEHRIGAALAKDQDCCNWDKDLKQAEGELNMLHDQLSQAKNREENLKIASVVLADLKEKLAVDLESKLKEQLEILEGNESKDYLDGKKSIQLALSSKRKEVVEVNINVEKAKNEVSILREAELALKSEIEREKTDLASMRQREGMASIAVLSLESEIEKKKEEIKQAMEKEKEAREKMVELPKLLQRAALEADQFKSLAKMAREELRKVSEEAEQAKATLSTKEIRLQATLKEMEAAIASERLALAAVNALKESEEAAVIGECPQGVTLPLEEYYILSRKAHEAEEFANERITTAIAQIHVAKESELKSLRRLEEAYREMDQRKEAMRDASEMAEKAKERKLGVEQELRKWRAEHEKRRKASDGICNAANSPRMPVRTSEEAVTISVVAAADVRPSVGPLVYISGNTMEHMIPEFKPRKKKSFFPRIVMFFVRRRSQSRK